MMLQRNPWFPSCQERAETYRHELKYLCSEGELQLILGRIRHLCQRDPHAAPRGIYRIRSVYFDDPDNSCFYENENGTDPREKFRIRIYNVSDTRITLECKRKEHAMTQKTSCPLTTDQCRRILEGDFRQEDADTALLRKLYAQYSQSGLRPKVIVDYQRTPFVCRAGNVRITFDRSIGSSTCISRFFDPGLPLRPILPVGKQILEVKYDAFLPDYLYSAMNLGSLRQTTFSKYYLCRKITVPGGFQ